MLTHMIQMENCKYLTLAKLKKYASMVNLSMFLIGLMITLYQTMCIIMDINMKLADT